MVREKIRVEDLLQNRGRPAGPLLDRVSVRGSNIVASQAKAEEAKEMLLTAVTGFTSGTVLADFYDGGLCHTEVVL